MPNGGLIVIDQKTITDTMDVLAKIRQMLEAQDTATAIRENKPYVYSSLTNKITSVLNNLTLSYLETINISEQAETPALSEEKNGLPT